MEDENTNPTNLVNQGLNQQPESIPPIQQPAQTTPQNPEKHNTNTKTIVTVIVLLFAYPIGLLLMWIWPKWPKWVKFLVTLPILLAIVGIILAVFVASKDPLKNLQKAQDANVQNTENELSGALFRYYNENGSFPWNKTATSSAQICAVPQNAYANTSFMPCIQILINDGQLKSGFVSPRFIDEILSKLVINDTGSSYSVCYLPSVKSASAIYDIQGNSCTTSNCYVCVKQSYP